MTVISEQAIATSKTNTWPIPHIRSRAWAVFTLAGLLFLLVGVIQPAFADYHLASWNIKHLGWANDKRDWGRTAQVISPFDFVAIQEVHTEESVKRLEKAVETVTGESWDSLISGRAMGSSRYKEFYAFMWRSDRFSYQGGATVFIDTDNWFFREPFSARFRSSDGQHDFIAANIHVIYGDSVGDREAEAEQLDEYIGWVKETFVDDSDAQGVLLMGDFNLPPQNKAFKDLHKTMKPSMTVGASTLSKANFKYANLYDQIWFSGVQPESAGIFAFPSKLRVEHMYARERISDHAPIYIRMPENRP
jgi:endonuclease/exonuclease/phosphatase family metal-dependent hydrolase